MKQWMKGLLCALLCAAGSVEALDLTCTDGKVLKNVSLLGASSKGLRVASYSSNGEVRIQMVPYRMLTAHSRAHLLNFLDGLHRHIVMNSPATIQVVPQNYANPFHAGPVAVPSMSRSNAQETNPMALQLTNPRAAAMATPKPERTNAVPESRLMDSLSPGKSSSLPKPERVNAVPENALIQQLNPLVNGGANPTTDVVVFRNGGVIPGNGQPTAFPMDAAGVTMAPFLSPLPQGVVSLPSQPMPMMSTPPRKLHATGLPMRIDFTSIQAMQGGSFGWAQSDPAMSWDNPTNYGRIFLAGAVVLQNGEWLGTVYPTTRTVYHRGQYFPCYATSAELARQIDAMQAQ